MRKRINISLDEKLWKEYQKLCIDKNKVPSYELEKFIKKELKKYGK